MERALEFCSGLCDYFGANSCFIVWDGKLNFSEDLRILKWIRFDGIIVVEPISFWRFHLTIMNSLL